MKECVLRNWALVCVKVMISFAGSPARAQNDPSGTVPTNAAVITISASDPAAAEGLPANNGVFTVRRSGNTNTDVLVFYRLSGTASNGVDYQLLPGTVSLPAGAVQARIEVVPVDDALVEPNESVQAAITPSPVVGPMPTYVIGSPNVATITIADNDVPPATNRPPEVQLVLPNNGLVFTAPANVGLVASARDPDGFVATVEFFAGTNRLGTVTNNPLAANPGTSFQLLWSNVPPGEYSLSAKATDNLGAMAHSASVRISVTISNPVVQPVVTIVATDPEATEIPLVPPGMGRPQMIDPAVFTVSRSGPTNNPLTVFYRVSGTASNGVDYEPLPGSLTIPAGARAATLEVLPIDDFLVEGTENVQITVEPPVCITLYPPPPDCYRVGVPDRATALLRDNDVVVSNQPPTVRITAPPNGAVFPAPANLRLDATTIDPDGYASRVEFFAGAKKIGEQEILFIQAPPPGQPIFFSIPWSNVVAGEYTLTARTTDNAGASAVSASVHITVGGTNRPPVTNFAPVVSIMATDATASEGTNCLHWPPTIESNAPAGGPMPVFPGNTTATFQVRRSEGTNADLTVRYAVGGTASNGIDYATLPGVVTIPAGARSAEIIVTPIDDNLFEKIETVTLSLLLPPPPPSNTPPAYVLGNPRRASAVILDNDQPRPPCMRLPDGLFHVCAPGTNGHPFRIEASTNCIHWIPVCTNIVREGAVHFVDPDAVEMPNRFYRIIPEANPPAQ